MRFETAVCAALVAIAATGCGSSDGDKRADAVVDGPFSTQITDVTLDCAGADAAAATHLEAPAGDRIQIDVLARQDGLYDLRHYSEWLPNTDSGVIAAVPHRGDAVNGTVKADNPDNAVTVAGTLTSDDLSLDFGTSYHYQRLDDAGHEETVTCNFAAHAEGTRRPVADPKELDGFYGTTFAYSDYGCPAPTELGAAEPTTTDVAQNTDGTVTVTFGNTSFTGQPPVNGEVNYEGDILLTSPFGDFTAYGTVTGALGPNNVDFNVLLSTANDGSGCGQTAHVVGAKTVPNPRGVANLYRVEHKFVRSEGCNEDSETTYDTATIAASADGFVLNDLAGPVQLDGVTEKGGDFSVVLGQAATDGFDLTVAGSVKPPNLHYTYTYVLAQETTRCEVVVTSNATVRYVSP